MGYGNQWPLQPRYEDPKTGSNVPGKQAVKHILNRLYQGLDNGHHILKRRFYPGSQLLSQTRKVYLLENVRQKAGELVGQGKQLHFQLAPQAFESVPQVVVLDLLHVLQLIPGGVGLVCDGGQLSHHLGA